MDLDLLIQVCSLPLVAMVGVLAVLLFGFSLFLVFRVGQQALLTAFFPLTFIPVISGLFFTLISVLSSISLQMDEDRTEMLDSGILLQMSLVPILFSLIACIPATLTVALGRWRLAWRMSGIRLFPDKTETGKCEEVSEEQWRSRETDDYLEKLVRPR